MSKRLEREIWTLDRCCGCGNCVALCAKGALSWGTGESPTLVRREKALGLSHTTLDTCSFCPTFCEMACPRLEESWPTVEPMRVASVRTRGLVQSGDPGDVLKHLLVGAMSTGLIDGAILPDMDPWTLRPVTRVATTVADVMDTLGVPYLWAPVLNGLNEAVYERQLANIAVVGTPCVSQAITRLRNAPNDRLKPYRQAVRLNVAMFCTGVYRPEMVHDYLGTGLGIEPSTVKRLEVSPRDEQLTAFLWDGSSRTVPLTDLDAYNRHGCARCDDYLGESSDLAIGTVGAADGCATVLVRSQAGEICLRNALNMGLVEAINLVDMTAIQQARTDKERRQRAQAFDRLMVMMLDAVGDPRKRTEVKQMFSRLYDTKRPADQSREEANCYVTCGQC